MSYKTLTMHRPMMIPHSILTASVQIKHIKCSIN